MTANLASNAQNSPTVFARDVLGNVVLRGLSGAAPGVDTFAIDRPGQTPLTLVAVGQPVPNLSGYTTTSILALTGNVIEVPRNLPDDLQYVVPVTATPVAGGASVGLMLAGAATGSRLIASSTLFPVANPPPRMPVRWPYSLSSVGAFVTTDFATPPQFPSVFVPSTVTQLNWDTSLASPQVGNMHIASNGTIIASTSDNSGTAIVMGTPGAMSVVLRDGTVISSPSGTARIRMGSGGAVAYMSIDPDGTAYVFCSTITLSNPPQSGNIFGVVRLRVNEPPRIAYLVSEPVRRRDGTFLVPNVATNVSLPLITQGSGRLTWFVRLPNNQIALCSLTDDGDPIVLFEASTTFGSPSIFVPSAIVPTLLPSGTVSVFSTNTRNDAVIAINGATPAVVVCPSMRFTCGDIDFNNDGVWPSDQDIIDFFNVFSGAPCPTLRCDTIDFNRNGVYPEEQDVVDFLSVLAGGTCGT